MNIVISKILSFLKVYNSEITGPTTEIDNNGQSLEIVLSDDSMINFDDHVISNL